MMEDINDERHKSSSFWKTQVFYRFIVTHLLGCAPFVVIAVTREANSTCLRQIPAGVGALVTNPDIINHHQWHQNNSLISLFNNVSRKYNIVIPFYELLPFLILMFYK